MAWNFRRSINLGPLRINLSKSGIGYSVGGPGFRVGQDARGRRYRWLGLPGWGIYRRDYLRGRASTRAAWAVYIGGGVLFYVVIRIIFATI
jgi:hypothetical protein